MIWPDRRSWNWLTLTHTKRVEFQADSKQSPNDFTVAPINARKSYWAPVIQRRFTSILVSPTEIKVSPSLYERVRIQLPKFKRSWVGPSVKVIPSEYNAVPAHSESVQTKVSYRSVRYNDSKWGEDSSLHQNYSVRDWMDWRRCVSAQVRGGSCCFATSCFWVSGLTLLWR